MKAYRTLLTPALLAATLAVSAAGEDRRQDQRMLDLRRLPKRTCPPRTVPDTDPDAQVTARIRARLLSQEGLSLDGGLPKVITVRGHVILRGTVGTPAQRQAILEAARSEHPLGSVEDQITLQTASS